MNIFETLYTRWRTARQERRQERDRRLKKSIAHEAHNRVQVMMWGDKNLYISFDGHPIFPYTTPDALFDARATWAAYEYSLRKQ